eukprot:5028795-Karenia_brevis.AAC.1
MAASKLITSCIIPRSPTQMAALKLITSRILSSTHELRISSCNGVARCQCPVSYTHLTLPTICSV